MNLIFKGRKTIRIIVLFSFIPLYQCWYGDDDIHFEDGERILVEGQILAPNNQPLPNTKIGIFADRGEFFDNDPDFNGEGGVRLSEVTTNSEGRFSTLTLIGRADYFSVEVFADTTLTKYTYAINSRNYPFEEEDYTLDIGAVTLQEKAVVNANIMRTSGSGSSLIYTLTFVDANCREYYDSQGQLNEERTICFETTERIETLDNSDPDDQFQFSTPLGTILTFTYSINGQPEETQTITIDQPIYEFNFNY